MGREIVNALVVRLVYNLEWILRVTGKVRDCIPVVDTTKLPD